MSIRRSTPRRPLLASIALAVSIVVRGQCALAQATNDENTQEATKYFEAGVSYLDDPEGERVEEAYRAFERAYELSKSPKVLGNIGLCAMKLERDGEAIDAYTEYLHLSDIDPEERAQIEKDLRVLTTSVAEITVTTDRANTLLMDSRTAVHGGAVTNAYGPFHGSMTIRMRQGHHVLHARSDGVERGVWEFDAEPGVPLVHHFRDAPAAPTRVVRRKPSGVSPLAWIITGTGAAALAAGGVTAIMTNKAVSDIERNCPHDACSASYDLNGKRDSARLLATTTNGLLIGGGLLAAAGVTWLVAHELSGPPSPRDGARRDAPRFYGGAACVPGGCALTLGLHL